ncbi:unnamed protein product [Linum trigynum]|uniref:Uncharacterized protein n=1 Tax=Linum trigynum TaxID=586398 RepID=A0AAV2EV54_9ROSI
MDGDVGRTWRKVGRELLVEKPRDEKDSDVGCEPNGIGRSCQLWKRLQAAILELERSLSVDVDGVIAGGGFKGGFELDAKLKWDEKGCNRTGRRAFREQSETSTTSFDLPPFSHILYLEQIISAAGKENKRGRQRAQRQDA